MTRYTGMLAVIIVGLLIAIGLATAKAAERSTLIVITKCGAPLAYTGIYRAEEGSRFFFIAHSKLIEKEWSDRLKKVTGSNPQVQVFPVQDETGEKCPVNI